MSGITSLSLRRAGAVRGDTGIPGLRLDFNCGLRLQVPEGNWHVTIRDSASGLTAYDRDVSGVLLISLEKYCIPWEIHVLHEGQPVFSHLFDPAGQKVRAEFSSPLLGDTLALLPYLPYLREELHAHVSYRVNSAYRELCRYLLPDIPLWEQEDEDTYATFFLQGNFESPLFSPLDARITPMLQWGQALLGTPVMPKPLRWPKGPRPIPEPYVCIGVQASTVTKSWLWPGGWEEVVSHLKGKGYRVLCIDKNPHQEGSGITVDIPKGAEDLTGSRPLVERGDMLSHADFYVGLSSGLAWLAYTAGCPVLMICGFTMGWWEFSTPYRVFNRLACSGCANDMGLTWYKKSCPRHKPEDPSYLECSRSIPPKMVIKMIDHLINTERRCFHP